MNKLVLAATVAAVIAGASAPVLIGQSMKEVHKGFDVSPLGKVSLCGSDYGYNFDANAILTDAKSTYSIESLHLEEVDKYVSDIRPHLAEWEPVPDGISVFFDSVFAPNTTAELEHRLTLFKGSDILKDTYDSISEVVKKRRSDPKGYQDALVKLETFKANRLQNEANNTVLLNDGLNKILASLMPKYEMASCVFGTDQYTELGEISLDNAKLRKLERKLSALKVREYHKEIVEHATELLVREGVEFDEIKRDKYGSDLYDVFDEDGKQVAYVHFGYSPKQEVYAYSIQVDLVNKTDPDAYSPIFYAYN